MPAEDADIALRLWHRFKPRMTTEHATRVYKRVDQPLIPVIGRMERRGVKVDRDYLAELSREFSEEIAKLEERIYEAALRAVHHRLAAATGRRALRPARPEGRPQGQERPLFDRRERARAACERRASNVRGWCSTGAS